MKTQLVTAVIVNNESEHQFDPLSNVLVDGSSYNSKNDYWKVYATDESDFWYVITSDLEFNT